MTYVNENLYEDMDKAIETRDLAMRMEGAFSPRERRALQRKLYDPMAGGTTGSLEMAMSKLHDLSEDYSRGEVAKALSMFLRNSQN